MIEDNNPPVLLEDLGMRFPTEKSTQKVHYGLYKCGYCGKEWETTIGGVRRGDTKSCGCTRVGNTTHNLHSHRLYNTWAHILYRCYSPSSKDYKNYGARGITVCDEWRETPAQFINDMFPSFVEGLTIDRIDSNKGYSKDNCRWATKSEQSINRRLPKNNTSGFMGINYVPQSLKFRARISLNKVRVHIGDYDTILEAAIARNNYIIENGLPHKLNNIEGEDLK